MGFPENLLQKLSQRERDLNLRSLSFCHPNAINLASNDYLGLSKLKLPNLNLDHGATGSRLISGNHSLFPLLEEQLLPNFHQCEAALYFNSGYLANVGLISAIAQRGDSILYDTKVHASIRDGIRLGFANAHAFEHNNFADLEEKLVRSKATTYVIIESVYSMDGDIAPLNEILNLCKKYNAYLVVDEAHALGVLGKGLCAQEGVEDQVFARIFTYGKALGYHGASVCGSKELISYLVNFSRPFIYTTAVGPSEISTLIQLIHYFESPKGMELQLQLQNVIFEFNAFAELNGFKANKSSIQFVRTGSNHSAIALEERLKNEGYFVKAIKSPTVPIGEEGIRITLNSSLPEKIWTQLFKIITKDA